jgi:hypothetical protein
VSVTDQGLKVEVAPGATWAVVAIPNLLLPPNARRLQVSVAELHGDKPDWIIKGYSDFVGLGTLSHWLPAGLGTRELTLSAPLTSDVLGAISQPLRQFQVGLEGQPGDYVVFKSLRFLP